MTAALDTAALDIAVLGPLEVRIDGRVLPLRGHRKRALLTVLTLRAGRSMTADALLAAAWGHPVPPTGRKALHVQISELRQALLAHGGEPQVIDTVDGGYRLSIEPSVSTDVGRFLAAHRGRRWADAEAEWRGDPLTDLPPTSSLTGEIRHLIDLRQSAHDASLEAALGDLDPSPGHASATLVGTARRACGDQPHHERRVILLMTALYADGRPVEALAAGRSYAQRLSTELGLAPSPTFAEAEQAIVRHDRRALGLRSPKDGDSTVTLSTDIGESDSPQDVARLAGAAFVLDDRATVPAIARLIDRRGAEVLAVLDGAIADSVVTFDHETGLVTAIGPMSLELTDLARLHLLAVDQLEADPLVDRQRHLEASARHRLAALPLGSPDAAHRACRQVAQMLEVDEPRRAVEWYRACAEAASHELSSAEDTMTAIIDARTGEARCLVRIGDDDADVARLTGPAIEAATRLEDGERLAEVVLVAGQRRSVPMAMDDALAEHECRALDLLGPDASHLRVRLLAQVAGSLMLTDRDDERLTAAQEALTLARELGDPFIISEALTGLHQADWRMGNASERLALANEAVCLADEYGLALQRVHTRLYVVNDQIEHGNWTEARAALVGAEEIAAGLSSARYRWATSAWRALLHLIDGDHDAAAEAQERALSAWGGEPNLDALACHVSQTALAAMRRDEPDHAVSILTDAMGTNPDLPAIRVVLARALAAARDFAGAATLLERFEPDPFVLLRDDLTRQTVFSMLLEVAAMLDDTPHWAGRVADALRPAANQHNVINVLGGGGFYWDTPATALEQWHQR